MISLYLHTSQDLFIFSTKITAILEHSEETMKINDLFLILLIPLFYLFRKKCFERALMSQQWKVNMSDIHFLSSKGSSRPSVREKSLMSHFTFSISNHIINTSYGTIVKPWLTATWVLALPDNDNLKCQKHFLPWGLHHSFTNTTLQKVKYFMDKEHRNQTQHIYIKWNVNRVKKNSNLW